MDFTDPKLVGIPKDCIPIQYGGALAPHVLNPGPRLAAGDRPWQFPELLQNAAGYSTRLIEAVQFAVSHTAESHRYSSEPDSLTSLLQDIVAHAKSIWASFDEPVPDVESLFSSLSRFCAEDARCATAPDLYQEFITYDEQIYRSMVSRTFLRVSLPEEDLFAPCSSERMQFLGRLLSYAKETAQALLSVSIDPGQAEKMSSTFSQKAEGLYALFLSGRIDDNTFVTRTSDAFREIAPPTFVVDIEQECQKRVHIDQHFLAASRLPRRPPSDHAKCPICFEPMSSDRLVCVLNCGHSFHDPCILSWFWTSGTCPLDRTRVEGL